MHAINKRHSWEQFRLAFLYLVKQDRWQVTDNGDLTWTQHWWLRLNTEDLWLDLDSRSSDSTTTLVSTCVCVCVCAENVRYCPEANSFCLHHHLQHCQLPCQTSLLKSELWKQIFQQTPLIACRCWKCVCVYVCVCICLFVTSTASAPRLSRRISVAAETSWTTFGSDLTSLCKRVSCYRIIIISISSVKKVFNRIKNVKVIFLTTRRKTELCYCMCISGYKMFAKSTESNLIHSLQAQI